MTKIKGIHDFLHQIIWLRKPPQSHA
jgi:hypothetical protein